MVWLVCEKCGIVAHISERNYVKSCAKLLCPICGSARWERVSEREALAQTRALGGYYDFEDRAWVEELGDSLNFR